MPDRPLNPFPGLRPFRTDEEYLFFGRDTQCQDLLRLLEKRRFIGVLGSSGTGKSSLVRAGLLPALYRGGLIKQGSHWSVAICRPGGAPIRNLAHALLESEIWDHLDEETDLPGAIEIETVLQRSGMGVSEVAQMAKMPAEENLLIVVDQFEELFRFHKKTSSVEDRDAAEAFVNLLLEGARDENLSIHVVLTMRSGFFGDCAAFEGLSEVINRGAYLVPRLTRDQLKEAIEGPAKVSGAQMAPRLIQRLLNDAGGAPDELPVLQHALMRTWDRWRDREIPHEYIDLYHYDAIGGMAEALSRHADEVYTHLGEEDQQIAQRLFKTLTEKDPDNRGIRRPISLERLTGIIASSDEAVAHVIDAFRIPSVSFLMPSADQRLRPDSIIDISHESLMRIWKRLGRWVDEEMQSARIYHRLTETAELWERGQADLYHDPDLHIARAWYEETRPTALWAEQYGGGFARAIQFLTESQRKKEEEQELEENLRERELASAKALADERARSAKRARRFSLIFAAFSVLLAFLAAAAYLAMRFARGQARLARNAQIVAERAERAVSQNFSQSDYRLGQSHAEAGRFGESLAYLARALKNKRNLSTAGDRIYAILTEVSLPVSHFHHRDQGDIEAIAFTPDSQTLITGSYDDFARIWDIDSNREEAQWRHQDRILAIAVSRDGTKIATGSRDGSISIFDRTNSRLIRATFRHEDDVNALTFSRDGRVLLTCSDDQTVRIWNWATGNELRRWHHDNAVNQIAFGPNESTVISVSDDNTARVWDIVANRERLRAGHDGDVTTIDVHPDQPLFATSSEDATAKVWSIETGECLSTLTHEDTVRAAQFSPDGMHIATCGHDRTVRLWTFPAGTELHRWAHRDAVDGLDFSPDGKLIASASDDQTVRIWETDTGWESSVSPLLHRIDVDQAMFSPDGQWLATVADNEVRVWRFEDFREPPYKVPLANVTTGALEPTGQWVAGGSEDGIVGQWRADTGAARHPEIQHQSAISTVIYSPDGEWLISGDVSGQVRVWEARTGREITREPLTHSEAITSLVMPRNGFLVVASGRRLSSWTLPNGNPGVTVDLPSTATVMRANASESYIGIGCANGTTVVCDALNLTKVHSLASSGSINALDFSQNLLATASDDWSARLWDLETGKQKSRPMGHGGEVASVRFSPQEDRLITGALDQRARMWSTTSASVLGRAFAHRNGVLSVAFSTDGARVVTSSADLSARVWDVETSLPLTQYLPHEAAVTRAAFTPGGRQIFTVAPGDGIRLWNVSLGAEGQLAPDIFLEVAEAIGGLQLSGINQLIPLDPLKRRLILRKAEMETQRMSPDENNAYLRFIRAFITKHGADLRPKARPFQGRRRPPGLGSPGGGGGRGAVGGAGNRLPRPPRGLAPPQSGPDPRSTSTPESTIENQP